VSEPLRFCIVARNGSSRDNIVSLTIAELVSMLRMTPSSINARRAVLQRCAALIRPGTQLELVIDPGDGAAELRFIAGTVEEEKPPA
jgi:hypothetical protein